MRQPGGKFRYNCTIIDLYDRSAVASVNSNYINTDLAIKTLVKALSQEDNPTGIIRHSPSYPEFGIIPTKEFSLPPGSLLCFAVTIMLFKV